MGIRELVEGYIVKKGVKRATHFIVSGLVGLLASAKAAPLLAELPKYGVTLDINTLENGLTLLVGAGFAWIINYVKFKSGIKALQ